MSTNRPATIGCTGNFQAISGQKKGRSLLLPKFRKKTAPEKWCFWRIPSSNPLDNHQGCLRGFSLDSTSKTLPSPVQGSSSRNGKKNNIKSQARR